MGPRPSERRPRRLAGLAGALLGSCAGGSVGDDTGAPLGPVIAFGSGVLVSREPHGPPGGKRALACEFCVPADPAPEARARAIDPTVGPRASAPGRIGCHQDERPCIGHTHQPALRPVLERLADLPFIDHIQRAHFE